MYAQHNEDRLLWELFSRETGVCVEVGANDGCTFSNTLLFEERGWATILVEPDPNLHKQLRMKRRGMVFPVAAGSTNGFVALIEAENSLFNETRPMGVGMPPGGDSRVTRMVECRTLDSILQESGVKCLDFVTIDVEGFELEVLRGFSVERWQPRVLVVENTGRTSNHTVRSLLRFKGYLPFRRTGCNDWYARADDLELVTLGRTVGFNIWMVRKCLSRNLPTWMVRWLVAVKLKTLSVLSPGQTAGRAGASS